MLEILGVSETKMKGNGSKAVGKGRCIFAGIEEGRAKAGVAILMLVRVSQCLREWKCVSERIVKIVISQTAQWFSVQLNKSINESTTWWQHVPMQIRSHKVSTKVKPRALHNTHIQKQITQPKAYSAM